MSSLGACESASSDEHILTPKKQGLSPCVAMTCGRARALPSSCDKHVLATGETSAAPAFKALVAEEVDAAWVRQPALCVCVCHLLPRLSSVTGLLSVPPVCTSALANQQATAEQLFGGELEQQNRLNLQSIDIQAWCVARCLAISRSR